MSDRDVDSDEMRRYSDIPDSDIERLLAGRAPEGDAELGELARFFGELREAYPQASTECLGASHVAAMIETARLLAENGEPVARPASNAHGPEDQASGLPKWRSNIMVQRFIASKWAKLAAVSAALVMAFGGVAFAGVLPAPVQNAVAGAAQTVGITLPHTDATGTVAPEADEVDATHDASVEATHGASVEATDSAAADNNDEQGQNVDEDQVDNVDRGSVDESGTAAGVRESDHQDAAADAARDEVDRPDGQSSGDSGDSGEHRSPAGDSGERSAPSGGGND